MSRGSSSGHRSFDVIHNSFDFLPLTYTGLISTPVVTTIHGFSSPRIVPVYAKYDHSTFYVAISDADRHPALDYVATIHHGIDAAAQTGIPLRIAGIIQDQDYFDREVAPRLDGDRVQYVGPVRSEDRSSFLGGAVALLHLIDFDEPFGFSAVEAMACGTPVIAFDRGSMPEISIEGITGSLVSDVASAAAAIMRVGQLNRQMIRDVVVQRFSKERMVDEYVAVYRRAITEQERRSSDRSVSVAVHSGAPRG